MAQHPFGPIENQLIVGYYKRGFDPTRVKPEFYEKKVLVPNSQHNPIHHILQPVFYGWSPANGNSSSHDFEVSQRLEFLRDEDLLSRGLGYRITFTMPSKQIETNNADTWPSIILEVLDFFGHKILLETEIKQTAPRILLADHLQKFESLAIEYTPLGAKIVENGNVEHKVPTLLRLPPDSKENKKMVDLIETHGPVLDSALDCLDYYKQALGNCISIMTLLTDSAEVLTADQTDAIKNRLQQLTPMLDVMLPQLEKFRQRFLFRTVGIDSDKILENLKLLTDSENFVDSGVLANTIGKAILPAWELVNDPKSRTHANKFLANLSDRWFFWDLNSLFRQTLELSTAAQRFSKASAKEPLKTTKVAKDFLLEIREVSQSTCSCRLYDKRDKQKGYQMRLSRAFLSMIPESNMLIEFPRRLKRDIPLQLIDLRATFEGFAKGSKTLEVVVLPTQELDIQDEELLAVFASLKSIVLCTKGFWLGETTIRYLELDRDSPNLVNQDSVWVLAELDYSAPQKSLGVSGLQTKDASLHRSETTGFIFVALWNPTYTWINLDTKCWLQCWEYSKQSKNLVLKGSAGASRAQIIFWISKRIYTYACVFTSDRLEELWLCHRGRFSPIRLKNRPSIVPKGHPTVRVGFAPVLDGEATVGMLRWRLANKLPTGHDCYRVGRLYLKY